MESNNERLLLRYISKCLCIDWVRETGPHLVDYSRKAVVCSGRPTATARNKYRNIHAILNLKILTKTKNRFREHPYPSYILEMAILCYLSNIEHGYIAICFTKNPNQRIYDFISPLTLNKELSKKSYTYELVPKLENMSPIAINYEICETWINHPQYDDPVYVWKIKVSKYNQQDIVDNLDNWWKEHLEKSPHLSKTESQSLFNALEENPNPFIYKPKKS